MPSAERTATGPETLSVDLKGVGKGPKPANGAGGGKPPADPPRTAYLATSGTVPPYEDDEDVVYLCAATVASGTESAFLAFRPRQRGGDVNMEVPGSETLFTFGQHRGLTYHRVVHKYPGYALWGRKHPSRDLANFFDWVQTYYFIDENWIEATPMVTPLQPPVPMQAQSESQAPESSACAMQEMH